MALAYGPFTPMPDYDKFRPLFRRRTEMEPEAGHIDKAALATYFEELARLRFEIRDEAKAIVETGWVEVRDFSIESGDYEVSAHILIASFVAHRLS